MRRSLGCLLELLETLLLALIVFLVVQLYVAQPYQVQQMSMENTLMPNQYVLVDKLTPHFDQYRARDIVIFSPPPGWSHDATGTPFIKRVIGVAGDKVDIHDGKVFVNGQALDEPYVFKGQSTNPTDARTHTWQIGEGQLFVMGDHRSDSQDSRSFGPIKVSSVIGRAWIRYWPLEVFGTIPATGGESPSPSPAPSPTKP